MMQVASEDQSLAFLEWMGFLPVQYQGSARIRTADSDLEHRLRVRDFWRPCSDWLVNSQRDHR